MSIKRYAIPVVAAGMMSASFIGATSAQATPVVANAAPMVSSPVVSPSAPADSREGSVTRITKVTVPMHGVAKKGISKDENLRIRGNCGTAFMYVSRVGTGAIHIDYGFEYLKHAAIFVNAQASIINLDGAGAAYDSYAAPQAYSGVGSGSETSMQRHETLASIRSLPTSARLECSTTASVRQVWSSTGTYNLC